MKMWQIAQQKESDLGGLTQISKRMQRLVLAANGTTEEVTLRVPIKGEIAVIDALNFVVSPEVFNPSLDDILNDATLTEDERRNHATDTAYAIGNTLREIMGDDFADVHDLGVSRNRYRYAYRIGHPDCPLGVIGIGNFNTAKPTILVMIYGEGCHFANEWWEFGLFCFLDKASKLSKASVARITRVDLCHDDFDGKYSSSELADLADKAGRFGLTNNLPTVQHLGDWIRHAGRGRTLQVGKRANGKSYRGYEKGKQLGDKESPWFRHEVELGNKAREIPLDVLLSPSEFFAGTYPYLYDVAASAYDHKNFASTPIKTVTASTAISVQKSIDIVKRQFGRHLRVYRDVFGNDTDILDLLVTEKEDYYPKRLRLFEKLIFKPPTYISATGRVAPLLAAVIPFEPITTIIRGNFNAIQDNKSRL